MEYNSSLPIYLQVANLIKRDIVTGKRELGEKLPSVRELAVSYTINPNTVSRVYGRCLFYQTWHGNFCDRRFREGEKYERRDGGDADP